MKEPDILPQQERENPEPHESTNPMPWPMVALTGLLVVFSLVYIATADIETPASWGDARQALELAGQPSAGGAKVDGAALYASLCAACHQASGQGLPGVFPPLAGSEWVLGKESTLAAILLHGVTGPLPVKGTSYNGAMPAFKDQLDDEQVAAVAGHIRSQWGNAAAQVSAQTVSQAREEHKARAGPFIADKDLPPRE